MRKRQQGLRPAPATSHQREAAGVPGNPAPRIDSRRFQIKKMTAGWTAAVLVLVPAGSLLAHHSLSQFDTTTAVRVKGVIVGF